MVIEYNKNGSVLVYAVVDGYLTTRSYYGYSKGAAVEAYAEEFGIDPDEIPELSPEDYDDESED